MQFDGVTAIDDVSNVNRSSIVVDHHAAAFCDRCTELDAQQSCRHRIRAADDHGLVRISNPYTFQTGKYGQGGMLSEVVRRAPEHIVGQMKADDAVGLTVFELHGTHENIFGRELAFVLAQAAGRLP